VDAHTFTKQAKKSLNVCQEADGNCFWDRKGVLMVEFMQQGTKITSEVYCETLKKMHRAMQNKRRGMLTSSAVFLHDNACLHAAACTVALLEHSNWELFDHPPYISDLASSDYYLFTYLKNWLGSQCFNSNELMEGVKMWVSSQAAGFFEMSIQKLIPRYNKRLNSGNDYIEK
jgi:hypothetical protein